MQRECPALDAYINIIECDNCQDKCDNPIVLDTEDMIINLFCILCPNETFIHIQQAYKEILRAIEDK